jgi:AbrB family looped-hinge helix DNA binding protein
MVEMKKGKHIFGTVKVGERGQIVIPKEAREIFGIEPGDQVLLVGDESKGIAIVKADLMRNFALKVLEGMGEVKETFKGDRKRKS